MKNNKEKAISLFKYIEELYAQRYRVVTDVKNQDWYKFISEIPNDNENIVFNYLDRTEDIEDDDDESAFILKIRKPKFENCPKLPEILCKWIISDWDDYKKTVTPRAQIEHSENDELNIELFTTDERRVKEYTKWNKLRKVWVTRQKRIAKTRDLFKELYSCFIELEKESETIELMVGQGVLDCQINQYGDHTYHPLLLKRVAINFDSKHNVLTIVDGNTNPEIYTMLLQEIDYLNHNCVKELKEELSENFYHPLDRNDTPDYLTSFAHKLYSDSRYEDNFNSTQNMGDKVIIYNNPVFFIRKKTGGILKALEEIIAQISATGELSGPLLNLIGENVSQLAEPVEKLDISQSLAAISGEDKDILLSKEANKEQLEIAKRIENYNAVLVQGPPGTGKTHTIANLMGHFLAQGKNILVTSQTKKALSVVKEKVVPELQNLCVAVLEDNNKDMERSVDGITEYISSHTSLELSENTNKLRKQREKVLKELAETRKKIYDIKFKEYETIIFAGKSYSVAEAANFVYDNRQELSYLPGEVSLRKPLPVSMSDLQLVYKTNEEISIREEAELNNDLPDPKGILLPDRFLTLIKEKQKITDILSKFKEDLKNTVSIDTNSYCATCEGEPLCSNYNQEEVEKLKSTIKSKDTGNFLEWQLNAILAGKQGRLKTVWESLIVHIEEAYHFSNSVITLIFEKDIQVSQTNISEQSLSILNQIKNHFVSGKKISKITLLMHKEWKVLFEDIKINNKQIANASDCEALIALIQLKLKRMSISNLWHKLIEEHGGIPFSEFGDEPEQACISYVNEIKKYLTWYHETYETIKNLILSCGFNPMCINEIIQYTDPIQEIKYLINLIYVTVPKYISVSEIVYVTWPLISDEIKATISKLGDAKLAESSICKNLIFSIKSEDAGAYKKYYDTLDSLYTKYFYQTERRRILDSVAQYAPEWAKLIQNRVGIHGKNTVPGNIEDAWKWKQFVGIIDEITEQPFEKLQHKSIYLNTKLKRITSKLAENSAWYYLLSRIEGDLSQKQALQGWKLTTKKIGKGTGKLAPKLKKEAQKLMAQCQSAVPAWIMPINKALENLDPTKNKFDIVIIDEASQSDISALAIIYLAKKIIIVGDDEQVSPSAVGINVDKMSSLADMYIKDIIPNSHVYDMKSSLYDIAKTTFPTLMLKEHFRCVPSIIGYCNRLSYDYKIKPLRDDSKVEVKPATIAYRVDGKRDRKKRNMVEAKTIVALIVACMEQPEYKDMTFGAISLLGSEQAKIINELAIDKIDPQEYEKRRILCGNASHFQGDERDIIFISLVDSNEGEGPLRIAGEGIGKSTKQRYNVAVSRAKNQLWVVHSLDVNNDLKTGDMRKDLIDYVSNPLAFTEQIKEIKAKADSPFEVSVANSLVQSGYHIVQQWPVGSYKIDMVAIYRDKKIAIECDGELYHSGEQKIREDMERQAILERLGWKFIRIRGSEYYRNPEESINRVISKLTEYEIKPEQKMQIVNTNNTDLQQRVIATASHILDEWEKENNTSDELLQSDKHLLRV